SAIRAERDHPFLVRRVGYPFGDVSINGGNKNFATINKGDLLAVWANRHFCSLAGYWNSFHLVAIKIRGNVYQYLLRLTTLFQRINFSVLGKSKSAIAGARKPANGVFFKMSKLGDVVHIGQGCPIQVLITVTFAQVVKFVAITPNGFTVFAFK